ncbi:hypothetical protein M378DRAFT_13845 [Amanita muscaria Koide BX008]|uniref:Uncharacterized protein n=1 Tax=Amanita muscaria (strain Koide BX008) TaxID=946122 RepID=A0A0C2WVU9_AMAMK|nr:hypothetical protein M378DRAFT_13845 [Amanita muscaria Koide BX008]
MVVAFLTLTASQLKSQTFTASPQELSELDITPNPNVRGSDEPLPVSVPRWVSDTVQPFCSALELLNVLRNPDSIWAVSDIITSRVACGDSAVLIKLPDGFDTQQRLIGVTATSGAGV